MPNGLIKDNLKLWNSNRSQLVPQVEICFDLIFVIHDSDITPHVVERQVQH